MRIIAIVSAILAVLLIADGIYMVATNYNQGETQAFNLPDGWIVIILAGVLVLITYTGVFLNARCVGFDTATDAAVLKVDVYFEE
jgi:hypothetical protein